MAQIIIIVWMLVVLALAIKTDGQFTEISALHTLFSIIILALVLWWGGFWNF